MAHLHLPQLSLSGMRRTATAHRDLKPENVLLKVSKVKRAVHDQRQQNFALVPKIGDFGIAKSVRGGTKVGAGTPHYMAPEVLVETRRTNAGTTLNAGLVGSLAARGMSDATSLEQADLYSFGCLMWSCLMPGCPAPFENEVKSFENLCNMVTSGQRPAIPNAYSSFSGPAGMKLTNEWVLPEALVQMMQSCWQAHPERRLDGVGFAGAVTSLETMIRQFGKEGLRPN